MIVVDSSALIAIFEQEADTDRYETAIREADRLIISAVNVHETGIIMRARRGEYAERPMWRFLIEENDFEIVPFDEAQVRQALAAFARYGKGIHPKARLNLADCAAYALARSTGAPLLFKGDDFAATDVPACV